MSSLIKGMEIPESCAKCSFGDGYSCYATGYIVQDYDWENKRADFCPLIEIPDGHGRLIDADAVERNLVKMQMAQKGVVGHGIRKSRAVVRDMPTIIPADDKE